MNVQHFLDIAEGLCYNSDNKRVRLGCVLVYKNTIISTGYNHENKTSPIQKRYNKYRGYNPDAPKQRNIIHAEINCLSKAKYLSIDWGKANLFICRILKNGKRDMARPCPACMNYIKTLGIKNIYYTTDCGWAYERVIK